MIVVPRTAEDVPGAVAALRAVHLADGYPTSWPADPAAWLDPPGRAAAWVAVESPAGAVLGHVCVVTGVRDPAVTRSTGRERLARASRLFASPAVRGRGLGVGGALLAEVRAWCDARDLQLFLDVLDDGGPAAAGYERLGWHLLERRPADWPSPDGRPQRVRVYTAPGDRHQGDGDRPPGR